MNEKELSVGELAQLGGVSRRTVRYYVQEGLVPPPRGLGRGARYGKEHLDRLLAVKAMQERGATLEEIRAALDEPGRVRTAEMTRPDPHPRSYWSRIEILPGLEVHVSSRYQIPTPARVAELAAWCREQFLPKET